MTKSKFFPLYNVVSEHVPLLGRGTGIYKGFVGWGGVKSVLFLFLLLFWGRATGTGQTPMKDSLGLLNAHGYALPDLILLLLYDQLFIQVSCLQAHPVLIGNRNAASCLSHRVTTIQDKWERLACTWAASANEARASWRSAASLKRWSLWCSVAHRVSLLVFIFTCVAASTSRVSISESSSIL